MIRELPPLSLYIHLPWCIRKCPYCDFNSHRAGAEPPLKRYADAVIRDLSLEAASDADAGRPVRTVFLGGGTPSLFPASEIQRILRAADRHLGLAEDAEITMEANPGTLEFDDPAAFREAGVNRLSIGAQSFSADCLRSLGRIHGPEEIALAVAGARSGGFDNLNLDLMFGLPGQDLALARRDVDAAIRLQPEHISYYQLTIEPNTVFFSSKPDDLPDEETCCEIQETGHQSLAAAGYRQYEVSAFSLPGRQCQHNLNYWEFGDYVAVGAGAHGKLSGTTGGVLRYRKPAHPTTYMKQAEAGVFDDARRTIADDDLAFEYMLNILRLSGGFSAEMFERRTGLAAAALEEPLARAQTDGLMERDAAGGWRTTSHGKHFLNDLQARFLPP